VAIRPIDVLTFSSPALLRRPPAVTLHLEGEQILYQTRFAAILSVVVV
jgi:hypothetical protein